MYQRPCSTNQFLYGFNLIISSPFPIFHCTSYLFPWYLLFSILSLTIPISSHSLFSPPLSTLWICWSYKLNWPFAWSLGSPSNSLKSFTGTIQMQTKRDPFLQPWLLQVVYRSRVQGKAGIAERDAEKRGSRGEKEACDFLLQLVVPLPRTLSWLAVQDPHNQSYLKLPNLLPWKCHMHSCLHALVWPTPAVRNALSLCLLSAIPPTCPASAPAHPLDRRTLIHASCLLEGVENSLTVFI